MKSLPSKARQPRRLAQVERVLLLAELLAPLRNGAALQDLAADIRETTGINFCERTIRRDLILLESLGLVGHEHGRCRWRWLQDGVRAAMVAKTAELVAIAREGMAVAS